MTKRKYPVEPMHFLNIDLEIGSKRSLAPLIAELGAKRKVSQMYVGRFGGLARAHYEVHLDVHDADKVAMALVRLVKGLSAPAMKAWRNARLRDFDIGIQSSDTPISLAVPLAAKTVAAIGALGARIVITVYAPLDPKRMILTEATALQSRRTATGATRSHSPSATSDSTRRARHVSDGE